MHRTPLRKSISWAFAGNVIYSGGQLLLFLLLANRLDASDAGLYVLALALTTPVFIFSNFALRQVQATDATGQTPFVDFLTLRVTFLILAVPMIFGIVLLGGYGEAAAATIAVVALSKAVEGISDILYGLFQRHERLDLVSRSMILRSVGMLPAFAVGLIRTSTVHWAVVGLTLAWLVVLLAHDVPVARKILAANHERVQLRSPGSSRWPRLKALILLALPLAIASAVNAVQLQVPRYLIEHFLGLSLLGIYAGMSYPMLALRTVVAALGESAVPRLAKLHAEGKGRDFTRLLVRLVALAAGLGLLMIAAVAVVGEPLIHLFYGPEYATQLDALVWIAAASAAGFVLSLGTYGINALRRFSTQPWLVVLATSMTLGLGMWWIPIAGLKGAAWAVLAAQLVMMPVYAIVIWRGARQPHSATA